MIYARADAKPLRLERYVKGHLRQGGAFVVIGSYGAYKGTFRKSLRGKVASTLAPLGAATTFAGYFSMYKKT